MGLRKLLVLLVFAALPFGLVTGCTGPAESGGGSPASSPGGSGGGGGSDTTNK